MKKQYVLNNNDLYSIFATRLSQVKGGFEWLYQSNNHLPDNMSPKEAVDIANLPIEKIEEAFSKQFGNIEPKIVDKRLTVEKKEAILKLYPNAQIVSFKEMYGHSTMWFWFDKYKRKMCEPSVTSFGDHVLRPRWLSVLSDILCFVTLSIIRPRRRMGEKCLGDLPQ